MGYIIISKLTCSMKIAQLTRFRFLAHNAHLEVRMLKCIHLSLNTEGLFRLPTVEHIIQRECQREKMACEVA